MIVLLSDTCGIKCLKFKEEDFNVMKYTYTTLFLLGFFKLVKVHFSSLKIVKENFRLKGYKNVPQHKYVLLQI